MSSKKVLVALGIIAIGAGAVTAHEPPGEIFYAVGLPDHAIPTLDGDKSDWDMIPSEYWVTREANFEETVIGTDVGDLSDFNSMHIMGWNEGTNKFYFMADVIDDVWDRDNEAQDDGFDLVIDADHSGGELWNSEWHALEPEDQIDLVFVTGQNYRFYVPPIDDYWVMILGRGFVRDDNFVTNGREVFTPEHMALGWSVDPGEHLAPGQSIFEVMVTPWENMYRGEDGEARSSIVDLEEELIVHVAYQFKDIDVAVEGERYSGGYDFPPLHNIWFNTSLHADFELLAVDAALFPTAVETDTWGRIKSDFITE